MSCHGGSLFGDLQRLIWYTCPLQRPTCERGGIGGCLLNVRMIARHGNGQGRTIVYTYYGALSLAFIPLTKIRIYCTHSPRGVPEMPQPRDPTVRPSNHRDLTRPMAHLISLLVETTSCQTSPTLFTSSFTKPPCSVLKLSELPPEQSDGTPPSPLTA